MIELFRNIPKISALIPPLFSSSILASLSNNTLTTLMWPLEEAINKK